MLRLLGFILNYVVKVAVIFVSVIVIFNPLGICLLDFSQFMT